MKSITAGEIVNILTELSVEANTVLRKDVLGALKKSLREETNKKARRILQMIIQNACLAKKEKIAICQDTGMPVVFVEIGSQVRIVGGELSTAINKGIEKGYRKGYLRRSIVKDPLRRTGPSGFSPCIIHIKTTNGNKLRLTLMPKGFGSENVTTLVMLRPTDGPVKIKEAVVRTVRQKGSGACPPLVIGLGIGGTAEKAVELSKLALIKPLNRRNPEPHLAGLEKAILREVNRLKIGPMGLGGKTTALAVNILTHPTHIAGLPLGISLSCHALRSVTRTL